MREIVDARKLDMTDQQKTVQAAFIACRTMLPRIVVISGVRAGDDG